jgi:CheY-like chemotaxis protein
MINHLLLIDDDALVRKVNSLLVKKAHLSKRTTCLANGQEGIEYLEQMCLDNMSTFPELIFLDIHMPCMNGWEFLDRYSAHFAPKYPNTKIVMITGSLDPNDLIKAYSYPSVLTFLQKPIRIAEMEDLKKDKHLFMFFKDQFNSFEQAYRGIPYHLVACENPLNISVRNSTGSV